jgi:hypothetical protein
MTRMASAEIAEAREAHAYWSHRAASLPWRKRAARREALELASRWRVRLVTAYLESWRLGVVAQLVAPLFDTRGRSVRRHVGRMAVSSARRTTIGRLVLLGVAGIAATSFACLALVVALTVHLLF